MDAATVSHWANDFSEMWEQIGDCFARKDLRFRAATYVQGLLGDVHRKNSWQLAEQVGLQTPHAFQRLLGRASWDAHQLRDQVRSYAVDHLLGDAAGGVLIVDETGFLKKGDKSVGVQRQYSGTAGRIENCQVGVFLAMASSRGRALIDRALYLPKDWCEDQARRSEAGVPPEVKFATKPQLAVTMLRRAAGCGP